MKVNLFRAELAKNELSVPQFAEKIGVSKTTVYRWFDNPRTIPLEYLQMSKRLLRISDSDFLEIFFTDEVA